MEATATSETIQLVLVSALLGSAIATVLGRPDRRLDNAIIGGMIVGFTAWRDPRASAGMTLAVAAAEGAVWGVADRLIPIAKDALLPPHP